MGSVASFLPQKGARTGLAALGPSRNIVASHIPQDITPTLPQGKAPSKGFQLPGKLGGCILSLKRNTPFEETLHKHTNTHTHACAHADIHTRVHTHTRTHTRTPAATRLQVVTM